MIAVKEDEVEASIRNKLGGFLARHSQRLHPIREARASDIFLE